MLDPFQYPYRSKERGDVWGQLAIHLNSLIHPQFKVRDRLTLLQTRYKEKMKREEMASGIDCEESEYKKEELALRVKELENKDAQQKMMADQQKLIQQQQHDMLQMMQKQQAKQDEQI